MDALGLPYRAVAPLVEEVIAPGTPPELAAAELAERKARAVAAREPDALVLAADQLAVPDGLALGKPESREEARAQLESLLGREHRIVTGVCLLGPGIFEREVEIARICLYSISGEELERYLDLEEWRGCAGGYRVEAQGQALFEELEGDRTGVQGLPMLLVVRLLRRAGVEFFHRRP